MKVVTDSINEVSSHAHASLDQAKLSVSTNFNYANTALMQEFELMQHKANLLLAELNEEVAKLTAENIKQYAQASVDASKAYLYDEVWLKFYETKWLPFYNGVFLPLKQQLFDPAYEHIFYPFYINFMLPFYIAYMQPIINKLVELFNLTWWASTNPAEAFALFYQQFLEPVLLKMQSIAYDSYQIAIELGVETKEFLYKQIMLPFSDFVINCWSQINTLGRMVLEKGVEAQEYMEEMIVRGLTVLHTVMQMLLDEAYNLGVKAYEVVMPYVQLLGEVINKTMTILLDFGRYALEQSVAAMEFFDRIFIRSLMVLHSMMKMLLEKAYKLGDEAYEAIMSTVIRPLGTRMIQAMDLLMEYGVYALQQGAAALKYFYENVFMRSLTILNDMMKMLLDGAYNLGAKAYEAIMSNVIRPFGARMFEVVEKLMYYAAYTLKYGVDAMNSFYNNLLVPMINEFIGYAQTITQFVLASAKEGLDALKHNVVEPILSGISMVYNNIWSLAKLAYLQGQAAFHQFYEQVYMPAIEQLSTLLTYLKDVLPYNIYEGLVLTGQMTVALPVLGVSKTLQFMGVMNEVVVDTGTDYEPSDKERMFYACVGTAVYATSAYAAYKHWLKREAASSVTPLRNAALTKRPLEVEPALPDQVDANAPKLKRRQAL